jgi:hypothetical protein
VGLSRRRDRGKRVGLLLKTILAAYVVAAALLPLSHHDLACHLKSPTHCTTCIIGVSGEVADDCVPAHATFADAGQAVGELSAAVLATADQPSAGRSPPARG